MSTTNPQFADICALLDQLVPTRAVSGLANWDSQGRRKGGVFGKRFGFERVPWPDPIRRICASAW